MPGFRGDKVSQELAESATVRAKAEGKLVEKIIQEKAVQEKGEASDGSTASYYELPPNATELQHLISYKNMNAQLGEIFRESYRYGQASHCDKKRGIKKILFYAQAELERLEAYPAD